MRIPPKLRPMNVHCKNPKCNKMFVRYNRRTKLCPACWQQSFRRAQKNKKGWVRRIFCPICTKLIGLNEERVSVVRQTIVGKRQTTYEDGFYYKTDKTLGTFHESCWHNTFGKKVKAVQSKNKLTCMINRRKLEKFYQDEITRKKKAGWMKNTKPSVDLSKFEMYKAFG